MAKIGFVFPGQGSQTVGMGKDLFENIEQAKDKFNTAKEILGFDLSEICFNGPIENLTETSVAQPALFTVSAILSDELKKSRVYPEVVAGHSLGEYSALYAAEVFDFKTGLELVKNRALAMKNATEKTKGSMAAIIGLADEDVIAVCEEASKSGIINIANINSPGQTVISGEMSSLAKAMELAKEKGAKRAIELPVSGAFHSPLMKLAQDDLKDIILNSQMNSPKAKIIQNVSADYSNNTDDIKKLLLEQITGSVRWVESINRMIGDGVNYIVEVGSGKVLSGLIKRIDNSINLNNVENLETLKSTIEEIQKL